MVSIDQSVSRIVEGLIQLHEFKDACDKRTPGLDQLHRCSDSQTRHCHFRAFYIVNRVPFKQVIAQTLARELNMPEIKLSPWYVLAVDQLEKMQPHFAGGIKLSAAINELLDGRAFNDVLKDSAEKTGKSYKDSFLHETEEELWSRLNIRPRIDESFKENDQKTG